MRLLKRIKGHDDMKGGRIKVFGICFLHLRRALLLSARDTNACELAFDRTLRGLGVHACQMKRESRNLQAFRFLVLGAFYRTLSLSHRGKRWKKRSWHSAAHVIVDEEFKKERELF